MHFGGCRIDTRTYCTGDMEHTVNEMVVVPAVVYEETSVGWRFIWFKIYNALIFSN